VRRGLTLLLLALPLAGCGGAAADLTGAVAGIATGAAFANPAVGYGVGVGTRAATAAGINWFMRTRQHTEQDAVAEVIGNLAPGEVRPWKIEHDIPIGNQQGEVQLVRVMDTALAHCREALFSVAEDEKPEAPRQWFLTTACRQGERWHWAAAEPATGRWGSLQ
jgi:hypothetical protein